MHILANSFDFWWFLVILIEPNGHLGPLWGLLDSLLQKVTIYLLFKPMDPLRTCLGPKMRSKRGQNDKFLRTLGMGLRGSELGPPAQRQLEGPGPRAAVSPGPPKGSKMVKIRVKLVLWGSSGSLQGILGLQYPHFGWGQRFGLREGQNGVKIGSKWHFDWTPDRQMTKLIFFNRKIQNDQNLVPAGFLEVQAGPPAKGSLYWPSCRASRTHAKKGSKMVKIFKLGSILSFPLQGPWRALGLYILTHIWPE